jgi:hypothetical protein
MYIWLGTDHLACRGGIMVFFLKKKNIPIRNVAEKNIRILVEGKKNRIQSFYHIT